MAMASTPDLSHHIKGLPPALKAIQAMGFSAEECLAGTGLSPADLENPQADAGFGLDQEFRQQAVGFDRVPQRQSYGGVRLSRLCHRRV